MALKQCSLCDRKFTKLEHVKRHERSHTRERPYECPTCKKHFSRSDVLFRHCKGHAQNALNRLSNSNNQQQLNQNKNQTQHSSEEKPVSLPTPIAESTSQLVTQTPQPQTQRSPVLSRTTTTPQVSQLTPHITSDHVQNSHASPSINVRPPIAQTAPSPNENRIEALINAAQHLEPHQADVPWRSPSPINLPSENDRFLSRQQDTMPPPIDPGIDMLSFSPTGHVSSLDQWAFELVQSNHPMPNRTPADALQTWLFPLENDILDSSTSHHMGLSNSHFANDDFRTSHHPVDNQASPSGSSVSIASRIPQERFARVESCWPSRTRKSRRLMPTLWHRMINSELTNILMEPILGRIETPISERERRNSRWGLDDECREMLQGALNSTPPAIRTFDSSGDTSSSIGESPGGETFDFPPAEILDIALEMYLYYFHPTLPIIHIPTFCAKTAPRPLLLAICLIGLSILGTAGASKFVSRTFPTMLQMASNELQATSTNNHPPEKQLRSIATTLLTLNLASITGRKSRISQAEKLYSDLISAAQNHGLFSANESPLPDGMIDEIMDIDARWKAWSRVECTKRIIVGLLEIDCWYATYLSIAPTIRPESVHIIPPCEATLYHAQSSAKWFHLLQRGSRMHGTRISPSYLPTAGMKLDCTTFRGLLTLLLLRIYESTDRLANAGSNKHLEPWRVYSEDPRSRDLVPLLVNLTSSPIDALKSADLNSTILWHACCMMLGANIRIFELAAGRSGPGAAAGALEEITAWAQTPTARRSIVHAAQIYKLLFDRKVSDIVTPHSIISLFQAALVLSLYIFALPPTPPLNPEHGLELLDLVDWKCVGAVGLVETPNTPTSPLGFSTEGPTVNFIRNGGPFSITNVAMEGGYLAARRTLLHCADLMDGMGRWKSRTFSQILHIMSDDLTDVDMADSDEA